MTYITKRNCKTCGQYYEGRGKKYCSNKCCKNDLDYQIKRGLSLKNKTTWNKGLHKKINNALEDWRLSGGKPWNKGLKGIHLSPMSEFKKGNNMGENNSNWKGGITPINNKIRKSKEYTRWRNRVYLRDNFTCCHCNKKCDSKNIIAHHIYYFSEIPELRFNINNGVTLCRSCHFKLHQYNKPIDKMFYQTVKKPSNYQFLLSKNVTDTYDGYIVGQGLDES